MFSINCEQIYCLTNNFPMQNITKALSRWKEILLITFITRTSLLIYSYFFNTKDYPNFLHYWVRWDGPHYVDIARDWYQQQGEQSYPLYPLIIKIFNFLIKDLWSASIIVSLVFSFFASIFLYELVRLDYSRKVAILSVWFLSIFPTSYFLQASYTESLFLTVSLATIFFFRKNEFTVSGVFGIFSTLTRINGLLLLPVLLLEIKNLKKSLIALLLTPVGFLSYLLTNYVIFGEFFYFTKPLLSNWYKKFELPWLGIENLVRSVPKVGDQLYYAYVTEVAALALALIVGLIVFFKIRKSYGVYFFLNLLLMTSTGFIMSAPRYILIIFPLYIALALIRSRIVLSFISLLFIALLFYFGQFYVKGQWAF